jgi:hypothetical protein
VAIRETNLWAEPLGYVVVRGCTKYRKAKALQKGWVFCDQGKKPQLSVAAADSKRPNRGTKRLDTPSASLFWRPMVRAMAYGPQLRSTATTIIILRLILLAIEIYVRETSLKRRWKPTRRLQHQATIPSSKAYIELPSHVVASVRQLRISLRTRLQSTEEDNFGLSIEGKKSVIISIKSKVLVKAEVRKAPCR